MFLCQCRISHLTIIVDLSEQGQTLAREPDHVVVELVNHVIMNFMLVSGGMPMFRAPMGSVRDFIVAQRLVFVKVGISNEISESACLSKSKVQRLK